jgi:ribosomal protein S24E
MKTVSTFKNELMKRQEIEVLMSAEKNPGFLEAQKKIAQHFKAEEDRVVVKQVKGKFGLKEFDVKAMIYDSVKDKDTLEVKKKEKKAKAGEAK